MKNQKEINVLRDLLGKELSGIIFVNCNEFPTIPHRKLNFVISELITDKAYPAVIINNTYFELSYILGGEISFTHHENQLSLTIITSEVENVNQ